jgi:ABC-2 type transport system permease protein
VTPPRSFAVAEAVARRHVRTFVRGGHLVPSLLFPCLFFAAFAGGLSAVASAPNFGYPSYTTFMFVFILLLASVYCAVFSALAFIADLESHFVSRMMLAVPRRPAILGGLVAAGVVEAVIVIAVVTGIGFAAGIHVTGNALDLLGLVALTLLLNIAASFWSLALALRLRSTQAAPMLLLPVFVVLFLAPVYVPRALLGGWLKTAARINPVTSLLETGRGLIVDAPVRVGVALGSVVGMIALFAVFAAYELRRLERQP